MKNKFLLFVFMGIQSVLYSQNWDTASYRNPVSKDELIVSKITNSVAQQLLTEQGLHLIGTGAQMMYDIEMLGMSFNYFNEVDIKTARKLIITSVQKYVEEINNNKSIHKYLKNYPFTAKNIEICIFVRSPDESSPTKNKPNCFSIREGKLRYFYNDPKSYSKNSSLYPDSSVILYEETYDEALKNAQYN